MTATIDKHDDALQLRSKLEASISGLVESSIHYTRYYSVDASSYMIKPDVVVIPKDENDVANVIMIAAEMRSSITPRGGGTGLVGGALNCGIILDMQNFNNTKVNHNSATVGAGVTKGKLDHILNTCKNSNAHVMENIFAPNPSVGPFCTIGGMIANNAAGSHSLKYGCTIDNVNKITIIDGTGNTIKLPEDIKVGNKILEIVKRIDVSKFPKVSKNSSGYRLDAVKTILDTHKVLVGSEGTLGIITSAELKIVKRPISKQLYILEYVSIQDATADCMQITADTSCLAAVEFVDKTILNNMEYEFKNNIMCLLFVEYENWQTNEMKYKGENKKHEINYNNSSHNKCNDKQHATNTINNNDTKISNHSIASIAVNAVNITCITDNAEISKWWRYRDASLHYSLKSIKNDIEERVPHVIEDATVPIKSLPTLFATLQEINQKYDTRTITYGHAGNGNIHVRLVCQKGNVQRILGNVATEYFAKIRALNGSMTGEHGDGLARSEFVAAQYGQKNTRQFALLKYLFDPSNIMNPGKIITNNTNILTQNLCDYSTS